MGGSGNPTLISCCLLFVCLCLTEQLAPYVDDQDVNCVPDINDMRDYNPATQTSTRCEKMKRERQEAKDQCQANLADAQHNLEACRLTASDYKPCDCPPPAECEDEVKPMPSCDADDMFFRRLVRHLVNVIQKKAPESGQVEAKLEIHLTSHDWKKLQSFADGKDDYQRADIHDVMVGIFYSNQTSIMEWLGERVNLLTVSITVLCLVFGVGMYMYSDLYLYAYIAAPRRVLREQPVLQQVRRRGPPALGAAREQNLPIAEHIGEDPDPHPGDGYVEGDRIENILPPTPPGNQNPPQGAIGGRNHDQRGVGRDEDEEGQIFFPAVREVDDNSVQPLEGDHEAGQSGLGPAVRPKTRPPGQTFQRPADGNHADTRSSDSIETVQSKPRPRDFGDSRPSRQMTQEDWTTSIGDSDSGALVSHPYSEKSDGESLIDSVDGSILLDQVARDTPVENQASAADEETTASSNIPTYVTDIHEPAYEASQRENKFPR